ncbi:MAG: efflux RND transporter periplasmic adaptor subunit [Gammaproteobacteria bacterium]|nr:efflux RND transporter periplasmic adaptor subunit [Gammaproteobacteria bacterium]NNL10274.1 efflux RND transporter periplasmic adaptor subunit [Pseudomonadales bacterium]
MRLIPGFCILLGIAFSGQSAATDIPVAAQVAQSQPIFVSVQLTGTVTSPSNSTLSTSTSGLVESIYVEEGAIVEAEAVLLELDAKLVELQLKNMQAKYKQEKIAMQDAERRRDEAKTLFAQKSFSKSSLHLLESEVAEKQAVLQQAAANMELQKQILSRHRLKAPFAGVVSKKYIEQGEWLAEGDGAFELVATKNLRADFYVAEDYFSKIKEDSLVQIWSNANRENFYQGHISAIVSVLDPVTRTFLLRVKIDKTSREIVPGMSVNALLQVPTGRHGIVVPKDALLRYPDGRVIVWTVSKNNEAWTVAERVVKTGESFGANVEVREGLTAGEQVVVRGNESLQNGQSVQLQLGKGQ